MVNSKWPKFLSFWAHNLTMLPFRFTMGNFMFPRKMAENETDGGAAHYFFLAFDKQEEMRQVIDALTKEKSSW